MNLAIINARWNSKRFPNKLMQPLYPGRPALDLFLERVTKAAALDEFVLATQDDPGNETMWRIAAQHKVPVWKSKLPKLPTGAEDVLGRTKEVAEAFHANTIVRLTPDCPCLHSELIHRVVIQYFMNRNGLGYTSNCWYKGLPRGMEVECFSREALEVAWEQTGGPKPGHIPWRARLRLSAEVRGMLRNTVYFDREHVTTFIRRYPRRFGHADLPPVTGFRTDVAGKGIQLSEAFPECRLTLDYHVDLEVLCAVFAELYPAKPDFTLMDIRGLWDSKPELFAANSHIEQKG